MEKTFSLFTDQISAIVSGTVDTGLINTIRVPYHGQSSEIKHVAMVSQNAGKVSVRPWDLSLIAGIEAALKQKGFQAYKFSKDTVCVNVPPPSQEEREKVGRRIKELAEEAKVAIRNIRRAAIKSLGGTEDQQRKQTKYIEELTKQYIKRIDERVRKKLGI